MIKKILLSIILLLKISSISFSENEPETPVIVKTFEDSAQEVYSKIGLDSTSLSFDVFRKAYLGFMNLKNNNELSDKDILTVVDFSKPSSVKRLFVVDMKQNKLLINSLVAHGRNTGDLIATKFSNTPESFMSSIGFFVTGERYIGKHKLSLRLQGLEKDFNDKALDRAIVVHGADYVSENFIKQTGRIGRSLGCPAVPVEICENLISYIEGRTCFFIYYPDQQYEKNSLYLNASL